MKSQSKRKKKAEITKSLPPDFHEIIDIVEQQFDVFALQANQMVILQRNNEKEDTFNLCA